MGAKKANKALKKLNYIWEVGNPGDSRIPKGVKKTCFKILEKGTGNKHHGG